MPSVRVKLVNRNGLHARPASMFVQTANRFAASVSVSCGGQPPVNGKSMMSMMMLAAEHGTELEIVADGPDSEAQLQALRLLVEGGFGEE
ncbi:MAG: HPr family phosphocarrier protein [Planctomycetota bacterium]